MSHLPSPSVVRIERTRQEANDLIRISALPFLLVPTVDSTSPHATTSLVFLLFFRLALLEQLLNSFLTATVDRFTFNLQSSFEDANRRLNLSLDTALPCRGCSRLPI